MARAPLNFDINRSPATMAEQSRPCTKPEERKQVGARIPAQLYRQLKSRAALEGVTVLTLVEKAIAQFLG